MQFDKASGKSTIEECKLKVVYLYPNLAKGNSEDEVLKNSIQDLDSNSVSLIFLRNLLCFVFYAPFI